MISRRFYLYLLACLMAFVPAGIALPEDTPKAPAEGEQKEEEKDIQLMLEESYKVGEKIEVKIKNNSRLSYLYNQKYPGCEFTYSDNTGREFFIPNAIHCDKVVTVEIRPNETKKLFEWKLDECTSDIFFGCNKTQSLPEGTYTMSGTFFANTEEEEFVEVSETFRIIK